MHRGLREAVETILRHFSHGGSEMGQKGNIFFVNVERNQLNLTKEDEVLSVSNV